MPELNPEVLHSDILKTIETLGKSQMDAIQKLGDKINCVDKRMVVVESKLDYMTERYTDCRSERLSVEKELRGKINGNSINKSDCLNSQFKTTLSTLAKVVIPIACVVLGYLLSTHIAPVG